MDADPGPAPILKPNGQLDAVICTYHDVTERKQAEEALRDSEERFRQLADASFEGLVIHAACLILDINKRVTDMLGYDPADLVGKPFWGLSIRIVMILSKIMFPKVPRLSMKWN